MAKYTQGYKTPEICKAQGIEWVSEGISECGCELLHAKKNGRLLDWYKPAHCPIHKAAPQMYEALNAARISLISDEYYQAFKPLLKTIEAVLATIDGGG